MSTSRVSNNTDDQQFVSPDAILTYRSSKGAGTTRSGGPTSNRSMARSGAPLIPKLGMSHMEAHARRVQSATGARKPARHTVGGRTARPYGDETSDPLSARTLPDIAPRAHERKVREWPSEVRADTFKLDLSHMIPKLDATPRGKATPREPGAEPEWRTPRDSARSKAPAGGLDEAKMEQLKNAMALSEPQRVAAPPQVNSPAREDPALRHTHATEAQREQPVSVIKKELVDSKMLAHACRRAGKIRLEGLAYYKMGVLMDNMRDYKNAIKPYKKFLSICVRTNDLVGEALAYNCIAVDFQLIGGEKALRKAIDYHTKHRDMADIPGKFTAYCNLGIAYAALGMMDKAVYNHQNALRHAIHMSSLEGESLACANLGMTGAQQGDITTAKACVERHLQLAGSMRDAKGQLGAHQHLGELAAQLRDYDQAAEEFEHARQIAEDDPLKAGEAKAAMCALGVAKGKAQMDEYMQQVASQLV